MTKEAPEPIDTPELRDTGRNTDEALPLDPLAVDMVAAQADLPADHRSGFVAVIGRPNVGKSTLLNQLLGQKIAIVSDKPQTTRDQLLGIRTDSDAQYIFLDTPGIHRPHHKLGKHMVRVAEQTIANDADLLLWIVEAANPITQEESLIIERLHTLNDEMPLPPLVIGLNKIDHEQSDPDWRQNAESAFLQKLSWLLQDDEGQNDIPIFPISAATGEGVNDLLQAVRQQLPIGPRFYPEDLVTDLNMRFLVAELIREQALNHLRQEIPHSLAVIVTDFEERPDDMLYIAATLYVERSSQKGIVLGRKGSMIKRIGQDARPQIEELVESRVYLELWVKVWEHWRRRDNMLQRLGYDQQP